MQAQLPKVNRGQKILFSQFDHVKNVDENYVEEYTDKVVDVKYHELDLVKEDLAVWINKILGIHYLNRENLLQELDNGAILCHLALSIKRRAKIAIVGGLINKGIPKVREKYFENAMRKSFFSRDNMENFIQFCRSLGVHPNLLFESDDLVLHNNWRNVILCLLEVARLSVQYGIEPPNLVQFEKEVMGKSHYPTSDYQIDSQISWQFQSLPSRFNCEEIINSHSSPTCEPDNKEQSFCAIKGTDEQYQSLPMSYSAAKAEIDWKTVKDDFYTFIDSKMLNDTNKNFDELDRKVEQAVYLLHSKCKCVNPRLVKLKIKKIGEGRYTIAGRNVFLLKDRHMMVRVGGGWDTFEHFLQKYDPCQVNGKEFKPFIVTRPMAVSVLSNVPKRYSYYSSFKKILRPGESTI
ncbi:GAS2-like protein pickled eggs isoform X2 [Photinus pyralis]|uniref:GAS2-like protein pickled eggs isoform X2 n=1 Tax=Photinus pyralis TaxID=7054 RepID=UPI00126753A5|nr:GAS2-like protein pickled eggs isoform X2 [Photinus pyralis]